MRPGIVRRLHDLIGEPEPGVRFPLVLRPGQREPSLRGALQLESGGSIAVDGVVGGDVPFGYHRLDAGPHELEVIVVPDSCPLPARRMWGLAAQLYATRSQRSWGIGDLGDLRTLGRRARQDLGADFLLINPLHATFSTGHQEASPYSPSTRRFLNPLYLDLDAFAGCDARVDDLAAEARALNTDRLIDRDRVLELKSAALETLWTTARERIDPSFRRWLDGHAAVEEFAVWSVLTEVHGSSWRTWPAHLRRPSSTAIRALAAEHHDRVRFHCWVQWLLEDQLVDAEQDIGIVVDLPIGFSPDGFDAWVWQDMLAFDAVVGAPPDELSTHGQRWGLPPFVPWRLRAAGYRPFVDTVRAVMRPGGADALRAMRIDHVMGLFRLWWVLGDGSAADGAYVGQRGGDLLGILALESQRLGNVVIGEDLGTVDDDVVEQLRRHGLLSYRVAWFEPESPACWPSRSLGTVTTHDLPTVAGVWTHADLGEQRDLELDPNVDSMMRMHERVRHVSAAHDTSTPAISSGDQEGPNDGAIIAMHEWLAEAPSVLLAATLDDVAGVTERPNIPNAVTRPNWCLALPRTIDEVLGSPLARRLAGTMRAATADGDDRGDGDAPPSAASPSSIG